MVKLTFSKCVSEFKALEFKNTKGETIGWISEDGTSSFVLQPVSVDNEIVENQRKIMQLLTTLQVMLNSGSINESKNNNSTQISEEQLKIYINDIINAMNNTQHER